MARTARVAPGGLVYHVLNRAVARLPLFRTHGAKELKALLSDWPVSPPRGWIARVNEPFSPKEREAIQTSMARGRPFGNEAWQRRMVGQLGLAHTMRSEGRPRKVRNKEGERDN